MFSRKSKEPTTRLRELSGSDFTIAKNQPDIRGWDVRDAQGRKFGTVDELIFDIRANKVRYMVLNILDTPELELEKRKVMIPIGMAELDPSDNDVLVPDVNAFQLRALPRYDSNNLGAKAERDIGIVFGRQPLNNQSSMQQTADDDVDEHFYEHDHFNEDNMYRRRRQSQGDRRTEREHPEEYERRREVELNAASSPNVEDEAYRKGYEDALRDVEETDEEFYRRTGRRRR